MFDNSTCKCKNALKEAFYDVKYQVNSAGDGFTISEIGVDMILVDEIAYNTSYCGIKPTSVNNITNTTKTTNTTNGTSGSTN